MDWLKPANAFIASWWAYIDFCLDADIQAHVCKPFWTWIMIGLFALEAITTVWVAAKIISFKLKVRAAARAEAERARIADEDAMRAHVWKV